MALDVCLPAGASNAELAQAVERTTAWGRRQLAAPVPGDSSSSGSPRAEPTAELRRRSIEEITALGFTATRSAGCPSARTASTMLATLETAAPQLPADHARYFMGIGYPAGILDVIARGIDMFDCVLPDPSRPDGDGVHAQRAAQPAQRTASPATRGRSTTSVPASPAPTSHARIFAIL